MSRLDFLTRNAPWLGAGAMLTLLSSFGQTFFISIFAGEIRADFGLSHAAWGGIYAREGLDEKTRWLCTVAALAAQGGQTRPQLKVNIGSARRAGASRREIGEVIVQMGLYGGFPAMINALNAALETFDEEGAQA